MSMFHSFNINASGLTAQRYRMDIISENVANDARRKKKRSFKSKRKNH